MFGEKNLSIHYRQRGSGIENIVTYTEGTDMCGNPALYVERSSIDWDDIGGYKAAAAAKAGRKWLEEEKKKKEEKEREERLDKILHSKPDNYVPYYPPKSSDTLLMEAAEKERKYTARHQNEKSILELKKRELGRKKRDFQAEYDSAVEMGASDAELLFLRQKERHLLWEEDFLQGNERRLEAEERYFKSSLKVWANELQYAVEREVDKEMASMKKTPHTIPSVAKIASVKEILEDSERTAKAPAKRAKTKKYSNKRQYHLLDPNKSINTYVEEYFERLKAEHGGKGVWQRFKEYVFGTEEAPKPVRRKNAEPKNAETKSEERLNELYGQRREQKKTAAPPRKDSLEELLKSLEKKPQKKQTAAKPPARQQCIRLDYDEELLKRLTDEYEEEQRKKNAASD